MSSPTGETDPTGDRTDLPPLADTAASEADLAEQAEPVAAEEPEETTTDSVEVDEFDAAEQGRPVPVDPEEYR